MLMVEDIPEPFAELVPHLRHRANLQQKERRAVSATDRVLLERVINAYSHYVSQFLASPASRSLTKLVYELNQYLAICKEVEQASNLFNWRSDFAGSVIPEFLHRVTFPAVRASGVEPLFVTSNAVVEMTLAGAGRGWSLRRKNQDYCLGLEGLQVQTQAGRVDFLVPLVVVEVKTNLDINKLSGLNFSAESLKRTFPISRYFVATETVDFSLDDNYVAGSVDEIYVLRKQMRSALRRDGPDSLAADVFSALLADVLRIVELSAFDAGHVYSRLPAGKLIHS